MKIDLSKYPPGTKFRLKNGKLAMLVGESPYRKGIYIVEYGDKGGHVDFSSFDGYIIFQDLHIESVIQPDKYLVSYKALSGIIHTIVVVDPKSLTTDSFYEAVKSVTTENRQPYDILSWSKIEE
jgi:hypothetical protein